MEHLHVNNDIKRFMFILSSIGYLKETEEQTKSETPQGFYEEYVEGDEPTDADIEEKIGRTILGLRDLFNAHI